MVWKMTKKKVTKVKNIGDKFSLYKFENTQRKLFYSYDDVLYSKTIIDKAVSKRNSEKKIMKVTNMSIIFFLD